MIDGYELEAICGGKDETVPALRRCAGISARYGLALTEAEMLSLAESREAALTSAGRVELGGGILPKLVEAFCDSPFIQREDWAGTLGELQEAFYYFKTDACDRFTDGELIDFMVSVFNGRAQGSAEYLTGKSLEELSRYARQGFDGHGAGEAGDLF